MWKEGRDTKKEGKHMVGKKGCRVEGRKGGIWKEGRAMKGRKVYGRKEGIWKEGRDMEGRKGH